MALMSMDEVVQFVKKLYPHGHQDFVDLAISEIRLHSEKNYDYARGGDPLGNFRRVAMIMQLYPSIDWASPTGVAIVYELKQIDSFLWNIGSKGSPITEANESRLRDISVYSKLTTILEREEKSK